MAANLKASLESTLSGLTEFSLSLQRLNLDKAIPSYQQLLAVLIQQKIWSENHQRKELEPLWKLVAQEAGKIYHIVEPFTRVMEKLRAIDSIRVKHPSENTGLQGPVKEENGPSR